MVECARLEIWYTSQGYLGFESLSLRHVKAVLTKAWLLLFIRPQHVVRERRASTKEMRRSHDIVGLRRVKHTLPGVF